MRRIAPPATLGMIGGGQLGRYAIAAARAMGFRTIVLEPDPNAPAGAIADEHLVAAYDDPAALDRLATAAVVTTEFENPAVTALERLAASTVVRPDALAIAIAQDRRAEKRFLLGRGLAVAPFAVIESEPDLAGAVATVAFPAILKTARLGYDGKGQVTVRNAVDLAAAWETLGRVGCVLEQRLALQHELSVMVARGLDGEVSTWDVAENHHVDGILDLSVVPARVAPRLAEIARSLAIGIVSGLEYVGVLGVELFVVGGEIVVNEIAPRPHNSGHWTLDAARTSQFEQQVRAVCGLALGDTRRTADAVAMVNLLGDCWADGEPDWGAMLAPPGVDLDAHLHLYGKADPRPGRKMGHLTVIGPTPDAAATAALSCRRNGCRSLQLDH